MRNNECSQGNPKPRDRKRWGMRWLDHCTSLRCCYQSRSQWRGDRSVRCLPSSLNLLISPEKIFWAPIKLYTTILPVHAYRQSSPVQACTIKRSRAAQAALQLNRTVQHCGNHKYQQPHQWLVVIRKHNRVQINTMSHTWTGRRGGGRPAPGAAHVRGEHGRVDARALVARPGHPTQPGARAGLALSAFAVDVDGVQRLGGWAGSGRFGDGERRPICPTVAASANHAPCSAWNTHSTWRGQVKSEHLYAAWPYRSVANALPAARRQRNVNEIAEPTRTDPVPHVHFCEKECSWINESYQKKQKCCCQKEHLRSKTLKVKSFHVQSVKLLYTDQFTYQLKLTVKNN
jgi:hypothetical protein